MSAFEVVVSGKPEAPEAPLPGVGRALTQLLGHEALAARFSEAAGLQLLIDLIHLVSCISRGKRGRATLGITTEGEAFEIGLEADGGDALVTAYRTGPEPEVLVHERRVDLFGLRGHFSAALERDGERGSAAGIPGARAQLSSLWPTYQAARLERRAVRVRSAAREPLRLSTETTLRQGSRPRETPEAPQVERADLHSLLAVGSLVATARGRSVSLDQVHPFLLAERLVALADDVLDAFRAGRGMVRRVTAGGASLSVEREPDAQNLAFGLSPRGQKRDRRGTTLVEIDPPALVRAVASFAQNLADAFVTQDPAQTNNLRLVALRRAADELLASVADVVSDDSMTNPEPDSYRSYGLPRTKSERGVWEHGGKMRFLPRWVATVPGIDLSATFHCGERVVVGGERETACLDSSSGRVLWRTAGARAASVATPLGVARIHQDGLVEIIDLETGRPRASARLRPRAQSGASVALVNLPGLPRLLMMAEGDRAVTAIDLGTGEVVWRYTGRRSAAYRLRRAGRLLLVAGGDSALVALDVTTGEVVWRVRDRLSFTGDVSVGRDAAFAIAGGPIGPVRLFHVDLWSGEVVWSHDLDARPALRQNPLITSRAVVLPIADRTGSGAVALDRTSGRVLWQHDTDLTAPITAWLAVDDCLIANSAAGTLLCLEVETGRLRYNHVFSRHVDAEHPRRLEPILRHGALFVPQREVHVLRPRDGELLGKVPSDLIPDLLRVDQRCNVYLAEESGHVAAFGVAPNLTLVR